jgi:RNA polymerase sigma-70 factor, ECF subfamily
MHVRRKMVAIGAQLQEPENADDEDLARRASGDRSAFIPLYDRYAARMERYVLARVGHAHDAEDIVSAVFLRALSRINTFDPSRGTFANWLFGVARNAVAAHFRRLSVAPTAAANFERMDEEMNTEISVILGERDARVRTAMRSLTHDQKDALALRYLGELSIAETAAQLDKSEAAIKMLVKRGLESLRRQLGSREVD